MELQVSGGPEELRYPASGHMSITNVFRQVTDNQPFPQLLLFLE